MVRYCVLISAITMFVLSAGLLLTKQRSAFLPFSYWYALALLLLAVGLFGVMIQLSLGCVVNWLSRTAQWLGGIYLLLAAIASLRESNLPLLPSEKKSYRVYYREATAVAVVFAAAALRLVFLSDLGMQAPYLTFYPAVMLAALYGGLRSGLLATALSAILVDYFWIGPAGPLIIAQPADWLRLITFVLSGVMIAWITEAMHRARARAVVAETQALLAAERESVAETMRKNEAMLEEAQRIANIGSWEWDVQSGEVFWSRQMFSIFGEDPASFIPSYESLLALVHPDDRQHIDEVIRNAVAKGSSFSVVHRVLDRLGETRAVLARAEVISDSDTRGQRFIGTSMDITNRKIMDDVLRFLAQGGIATGEDFFQSLANHLAQSLDMDYVCIDTIEEGSLTAQTVAVYFDGKFEDNVVYTLKDTPCGDVVEKKVCCFPKDVRHLFPRDQVLQDMLAESYIGTTLCNSQGQLIGLIAVLGRKPLANPEFATSILQLAAVRAAGELERRQAEEQVNTLNEQLKLQVAELDAANKELESFSYSVSHDLRAPLRHISSFEKLLRQRLQDHPDEKVHHYADLISTASKRMSTLIDDLLNFSRIGRTELQKRKINFNDLVRGVVQEFQGELEGRKVIWDIGKLPSLYGDRALLRLVIVNLVSNAVKFTNTRSAAEIRIRCQDEGDKVIFSIADNGVGFNMKYADKLFGVFQRLHRQDEFEGTGIGLAHVQRIISRHGGKVWAESLEGQGATFYFTLPNKDK